MIKSKTIVSEMKPTKKVKKIPILFYLDSDSDYKENLSIGKKLSELGPVILMNASELNANFNKIEISKSFIKMQKKFKTITAIDVVRGDFNCKDKKLLLFLGNKNLIDKKLKENIQYLYSKVNTGEGFKIARQSFKKDSIVLRSANPSIGINAIQIGIDEKIKYDQFAILEHLSELSFVCSAFTRKNPKI